MSQTLCDCPLVLSCVFFPLNFISSEKGVFFPHKQPAGIHGLQADVVASSQILCRATKHAAVVRSTLQKAEIVPIYSDAHTVAIASCITFNPCLCVNVVVSTILY